MFEATSDCQHYLGIAARAGVNKDTEYNSFATSQLSRIGQTIRSVEILFVCKLSTRSTSTETVKKTPQTRAEVERPRKLAVTNVGNRGKRANKLNLVLFINLAQVCG